MLASKAKQRAALAVQNALNNNKVSPRKVMGFLRASMRKKTPRRKAK